MSGGRWYLASWRLPSGSPSYSEIWAADRKEAEAIARRLRFGEVKPITRAVTEYRPSRLADLPGGLARADVLHSLCYLSTLAARAGVVTAEQLVEDGSPIHELAHYLGCGPNIRGGKQREYLIERLRWLESIIPGMPPNDIDLPVKKDVPGQARP